MALFSKKTEEPFPILVKGKQLNCSVCSNDLFLKKRIQLKIAVLIFFNNPWRDTNATCYVCSSCTHIMWFDT